VYGVLPASALFMILYAKMSNVLSKKALFYATCTPFFVFYALFCTVIYPNRHLLMPDVRAMPACVLLWRERECVCTS
jgi:ATP:ADP antiporter, AAA family